MCASLPNTIKALDFSRVSNLVMELRQERILGNLDLLDCKRVETTTMLLVCFK